MDIIRTYGVREKEYNKLATLAKIMNDIAFEKHITKYYEVKNVYFDFGLNWKWTTIVAEDFGDEMSFQLLCPRDYEIILANDSFDKLYEIAEKLVK